MLMSSERTKQRKGLKRKEKEKRFGQGIVYMNKFKPTQKCETKEFHGSVHSDQGTFEISLQYVRTTKAGLGPSPPQRHHSRPCGFQDREKD